MHPHAFVQRASAPTPATDKLARLRQVAADPAVGCGNFLSAALRISRNPNAPKIWLDEPFLAPNGDRFKELSLVQLAGLAQEQAARYLAAGVGPRDPVAVSVPDGIAYLVHFLAMTSLGAIAVLVNPAMQPELAAGFVQRVGAIGLIADETRLATIMAHLPAGALRFATPRLEEMATLPKGYPFVHAPEDPVLLCHSSGTTGIPKAVTFQHHAFFYGVRYRLTEEARPRRMLSALPHSHSAGIAFPMLALLRDEPVMMVKGDDPERVLAAAERFQATTLVAFAHTFVEISQVDGTKYDLSNLRAFINTGDAAHITHIRKLVELGGLEGSVFIDGLGSSEMGFSLFQIVHGKGTNHPPRCVGKPLEFVDAQVLGESGERLPANTVGRLGVKSPTLTAGYWNDSVLTFRSRLGGYWLTGDLVYKDGDGRFFHVDRTTDAIKTKGGVVHSLLTEEILQLSHGDIVDVCVVGRPQADGFETPVALLRPAEGDDRDAALWLAALNAALAANQLPALEDVLLPSSWGDLPSGPTGKVLKRKLREHLAR
jgi:acyl-coenzyme A synthetase/AMP-(fatty) acid ligase